MANNEAQLSAFLKKYICPPCGRDNPPHHEVLKIFQLFTPPECEFYPTKLWAAQRNTENSTCCWHVLYTLKNPASQIYRVGNQAFNLKNLLLRSPPAKANVMEYYFYRDQDLQVFNQGWVMVWKLVCQHAPNFCNDDKLLKTKGLPAIKIN